MYQSPQYAVPPFGGYGQHGYSTPKASPQAGGTPDYYSSRYMYPNTPSPRASSKRHDRTASQGASGYYASPGMPPRFYSSPYGSTGYYSNANASASASPEYSTPKRSTEYVPVYGDAEATPRRSRARRASHSTRPATANAKATNSTPLKTPASPTPKATEADALRMGIPAGYSYKNWDPTESPVMLLGSVFDANSLGKWVYDWTVFHHGPATPMSEIAGDLWLLLIQLAGKVKRADECLPRVRRRESIEMIEDFLESGERLWNRLQKLLKACEEFMWKAAERKSARGKAVSMGKNSGCEFVDSIFGRDRELENTEKLMTGMRLWSMRFDANCEEILRRPSA